MKDSNLREAFQSWKNWKYQAEQARIEKGIQKSKKQCEKDDSKKGIAMKLKELRELFELFYFSNNLLRTNHTIVTMMKGFEKCSGSTKTECIMHHT